MEFPHFLRAFALLASLVAALLGCASTPFRVPFLSGPERGFSQEELADELNAFATRFSGMVSTAAEEMSTASDDPAIRRRGVLWGLKLSPAIQEAAFLPNPQHGYVRVLTVAVMMRHYLTTGDGRNLFGASQPIAVAVAEMLEADAYAIGARFLAPKELAKARREVDRLAERYPIQGTQFSLVRAREALEEIQTSGPLHEVISLPLAPFHALQGVDTGAAAVRDFNQTARRFSTIVGALPAELRGQMQLLLLDADDLRTVRQSVAAFEQAAASAERVSFAVDRLPEELRATLDQEVRAALEASEGPLREASHAMAQANELAGPLQETATQLREASTVWRDILRPSDPTPRAPDDRPFDVREWEGTVRTLGASAVELRALATELKGLAGELQGFSLSAGVDRLFWRAVALIVVFFVLLLAYRVLAARLVRRA